MAAHYHRVMIEIVPGLAIDEAELSWRFARASGPGGQHVNRTESAVELRFDARASDLPPAIVERALALAGPRRRVEGTIVINARRHRSQERNRADALARLVELLGRAAEEPKKRRPTKPSRAAKQRRVDEKKRRAQVKRGRERIRGEE